MDDSTFKQLKESNGLYPKVTEVIFEQEKMTELGIVALTNIEKAFDIVWIKLCLTLYGTSFELA
jgi:hypothetical protein